MNRIEAAPVRTKFASEPHLAILVDGEPLDELLHRVCPDLDLSGLIPAWLDRMIDDSDQQVARDRMAPPAEGRLRVLLLICPDDLDFSCSTVIADVIASEAEVEWTCLGLDRTESHSSDDIGRDVEWFNEVGPMRFARSEYDACVAAFRAEQAKAQSGRSGD